MTESYCSLTAAPWPVGNELTLTDVDPIHKNVILWSRNVLKIHLVLTQVIKYCKQYLMPPEALAAGEKLFKMPTNGLTRQCCVKESQSSRALVPGLYCRL